MEHVIKIMLYISSRNKYVNEVTVMKSAALQAALISL